MPVVDANVLVVMVSGDSRRQLVLKQITRWLDEDAELHAPLLAHYEIASALTRWVARETFPLDKIEDAVEGILVVPVHYHPITNIPRPVEIARKLQRQSAYDAAYLQLAESLDSALWTLDGPLYRNAIAYGFDVRLIQ